MSSTAADVAAELASPGPHAVESMPGFKTLAVLWTKVTLFPCLGEDFA
ncbi:MAG TPA: hypothetical protein VFC19_40910 [Candidatus Limnocylindrales bacterium]|nr:hypothetical protein [Candidatus Limnocylindrales bacterium]